MTNDRLRLYTKDMCLLKTSGVSEIYELHAGYEKLGKMRQRALYIYSIAYPRLYASEETEILLNSC